ncbi:ribonuclease Z [Candidatus Woesearchaeota archaeon]|nr:ribonuclease Z [Candidatus Woesearchaeota archaeon]
MHITFLGTSCMVPTKERNHSGIFLEYGAEGILVDCGEGIQRQMKIADIKPTKVTKILISHWHGDHVLGIPGLMQTLASSEYGKTLQIYGPKGTEQHIAAMFKAFLFDCKVALQVHEVNEGVIIEQDSFSVTALPLKHGIPCLGFRFIEADKRRIKVAAVRKLGIPDGPLLGKLQDNKSITWKGKTYSPEELTYLVPGKKIAFVIDTEYCANAITLAQDADLLICEASYTSNLEEKAKEYHHLTAKQAGLIANRANVKKLILTHFSQRYKTTQEIEEDARDVFTNVSCAYDFMKVKTV